MPGYGGLGGNGMTREKISEHLKFWKSSRQPIASPVFIFKQLQKKKKKKSNFEEVLVFPQNSPVSQWGCGVVRSGIPGTRTETSTVFLRKLW